MSVGPSQRVMTLEHQTWRCCGSVATHTRVAGLILLLTGILKLLAVMDLPKLQVARDPVFATFTESAVLIGAASLEIASSAITMWRPSSWQAALALSFTAGSFVCYHVGLWIVGYKGGCLCLGRPMTFTSLFRGLHGDTVALGLLAYLIVVAGFALRSSWRGADRAVGASVMSK